MGVTCQLFQHQPVTFSRSAEPPRSCKKQLEGAVYERIPDYNQVTYYAIHNCGDDAIKDRFARRVMTLIGFAKQTAYGPLRVKQMTSHGNRLQRESLRVFG